MELGPTIAVRDSSLCRREDPGAGQIQLNDLENLPFFLVAGFLFVLTNPSLPLAQWLLYGYAASRLLHFAAYFTAQTHDMRAALWTVGSLILIFMTCRILLVALGLLGG